MNQETSTPHRIIEPTTKPAQKTRAGFSLSDANPAGEKFVVRKDTAVALIELCSCFPIQTLFHVFTATFPLIFKSLGSRARTQLRSSLQRLCQQRNPLPLLCVVSIRAEGCLVVQWPESTIQQCSACRVSAVCHLLWNRYESKLVGNFPQVLPFYKICGRNC